ncbi:hypothetical protein B4903_23220, partial [Yersinia frederiksenii]
INKSGLSDIWSVAAGVLRNKREDKDLNNNGTYSVMRAFSWRKMTSDDIRRVQNIHGVGERLISSSYTIPDDGLSQFMDCSIWILFGSSVTMPIAPIKPIAIYYSEDLLNCKSNRQAINNPLKNVHASSRALSEMISFCSAIFVDNEKDFSSILKKYTISTRWLFNIKKTAIEENSLSAGKILNILESIK